jgi:hypothetical protein
LVQANYAWRVPPVKPAGPVVPSRPIANSDDLIDELDDQVAMATGIGKRRTLAQCGPS